MSTEINSLKYFMHKEAQEEIVEVPGVESFKDENGKIIPFKLKSLSLDTVDELRDNYTNRKRVKDAKGRYITDNGELVYENNFDQQGYMDRLIVEAFVFPDMKDQKLMDSYKCHGYDEMPRKMFSAIKDYKYVSGAVIEVLGLRDEGAESVIDKAKNS